MSAAAKSSSTAAKAAPAPAVRERTPAAAAKAPAIQAAGNQQVLGAFGVRAPLGAALGAAGEPLPREARGFFEPRLGRDLSGVRIHTGGAAADASRQLGARAFTIGDDVVFGAGAPAPESRSGRQLLAHELAHVAQAPAGEGAPLVAVPGDAAEREAAAAGAVIAEGGWAAPRLARSALVHRDPIGPQGEIAQYEPKPFEPGGKGLPGPDVPSPPATGATVEFMGVTLSENPEQLRYEMLKLIIARGRHAPTVFTGHMYLFFSDIGPTRCYRQWGDCVGGDTSPESKAKADTLRSKILPVLGPVIGALHAENENFLALFKNVAKANARAALDASEREAKQQAVRYGLTERQVEHISYSGKAWGEPVERVRYTTEYGMDETSPTGKELQAAAKILLDRRRKMAQTRSQRDRHSHSKCFKGDCWDWTDPEYDVLNADLAAQEKSYADVRTSLIAQHPALAAFSELDKGTGALETLAGKGPGPEMAAVVGTKIAELLENIRKVREGLDDDDEVNVWRLPKLVGLTKAQLGVEGNPLQKKLVEQKYDEEQPGLLESLALLVLNIAALALAGPTGGLSLVVAAGVNAYVAIEHVQEYLTQEALTQTHFDRAKALSQDEPSLFWLAVEIVGVFLDVGAAGAAVRSGFKTLAPLAKSAQAAKEGEEAVKALEALELAAKELKGEEFAASVVAKVKQLRSGEGAAVKFAGATKEEAAALEAVAKAQKIEAEAAGAVKAASGEVTVSRAGHLYGCSSPCTVLREKFAAVLADNPKLESTLAQLEERARAAAKAGDDVAKKAIAEEAAALNRQLRQLEIDKALKALGPTYKILQDVGLDAAAIERVLAKAGNLDHMKGQLLEELLASRVRQMLGTEAGRATLAGERAAAKLEFIEGHRIADASNQLFTDGVVVIREGDKLRVVTVFESKAGRASSRGLRYAYKSVKEMSAEELKVLRMEAIEELRAQNKAMARLTSAQIEAQFPNEVDKMMQALPKGEAGQVTKSVERLVPNAGEKTTTILIDGKPVEVIGGRASTKVVGVVPSDVATETMAAGFKANKLNFEALHLDIKQGDLKKLAEDLAALLVGPP